MHTMTFLTAHQNETARLARQLDNFTAQGRTASDYLVYAGFAESIKTLKNLGVRQKAVAELETKLAALAAEVFPEKSN